MKLGSYNVFKGAEGTYDGLAEFVEGEKFDVLCLQELNGWTAESLESFGARTGLPNVVLGEANTGFNVAVLTRLPVISSAVHTNDFWHCAVQMTVEGEGESNLSVSSVHLNPYGESARVVEAEHLLRLIGGNVPALLMGDFNSLSRLDKYGPTLREDLLASGITKRLCIY